MIDAWTIRPFSSLGDYEACVALQEETWGHGFSERVPTAILKVSQILGGVAAGAWSADGRLLGFVFGMTGQRDGEPVHWSDMLAVRPEARSSGLGTALKHYQRTRMLEAGIHTVLWTFDPLRARNAHLNFTRLGVRSDEYVEDMYGATDSPLHRGIGTDRLVVRWELDDPEVEARVAGTFEPPASTERLPAALDVLEGPPGLERPGSAHLGLESSRVTVCVPANIGGIMQAAPELALEWRRRSRLALTHYLARGWEVRAFLRDAGSPRYLLVRVAQPGDAATESIPAPSS
ncbi:MAG: GNAT family N-acetyltransferase [Gemmatimonadetes bacterium]|nr:GNAT family N-acetyltransferase [Gemmatimonadota bacterium]